MSCLEPIVGSGTTLKETPRHIDPDDGMFSANQSIDEPIIICHQKRETKLTFQSMKNCCQPKILLKKKVFVISFMYFKSKHAEKFLLQVFSNFVHNIVFY